MIALRTMTASDVEAGLALCRSAGWNQLAADWLFFLQLKPEGARVAVDNEGNVAGTVATIDYDDHFSWIGMVLVSPGNQRQGIGTQLLREALDMLHNADTIKLDATPAGREVYLKLGFKDEYTLCRMISDNVLKSSLQSKQTEDLDLVEIKKADAEAFGADRMNLLKKIYDCYPELSATERDAGADQGIAYAFGRKGYHFTQVGPVVADSLSSAKNVTSTVFANTHGPVVLDVMEGSPFHDWLKSIGFREQRKLIRMYKGTNRYPGTPSKQHAILGPEFG